MTAPFSIADAFATAAVANRNPTWGEYKSGSPCEQRAIIKRWFEIAHQPQGYRHSNDYSLSPQDQAWENWQRAQFGNSTTLPASAAGDHEEYKGEAADRNVDARGFNLGGQE